MRAEPNKAPVRIFQVVSFPIEGYLPKQRQFRASTNANATRQQWGRRRLPRQAIEWYETENFSHEESRLAPLIPSVTGMWDQNLSRHHVTAPDGVR